MEKPQGGLKTRLTFIDRDCTAETKSDKSKAQKEQLLQSTKHLISKKRTRKKGVE